MYNILCLLILLFCCYNEIFILSFTTTSTITTTHRPLTPSSSASSSSSTTTDNLERRRRNINYGIPSRHFAVSNVNETEEKERNENNVEKRDDTKLQRDEIVNFGGDDDRLGAFDPGKKLPLKREVIVGDPQIKLKIKENSVAEILTELAAIQKQGPQKYCILGSRHVSYLHQQIIELLSYALVLSENHVYTSGAGGTNAAAIKGALRAGRDDLLTVILPQSLGKQTKESQDLLMKVTDLITMPQNDDLGLDVASRLCNSKLLSETDQLVAFAFHESTTIIEATKEAKKLEMLVTTLFLD